MAITGAGILFTDGVSVIAGFHPSLSVWSGIGGKCEEGEEPYQTAIRECVEEVFGLRTIPDGLAEMIPLGEPILRGEYALFTADFETLLVIAQKVGPSPFYSASPESLDNLVERRVASEDAEISALKYLPLAEVEEIRETLAREFYRDLTILADKFPDFLSAS